MRLERNRLAYPCGVTPGFDPTHPYSRNAAFSAISTGANFFSILTGGPMTAAVAAASATTILGPSTLFNGTVNQGLAFGAGVPNIDVTLAAIFLQTSSTTGPFVSSGDSNGLHLRNNVGTYEIRIYGTASLTSGISSTLNAPMFYCASASRDSGTWSHNHVVVNLSTGKVSSSSTTGTVAAAGTDGTKFRIGSADTAAAMAGYVAAGLVARDFKGLPALLLGAADPWAFWYPRRDTMLVGAAAAAFKAYWAQQNNLPVIGAGTY